MHGKLNGVLQLQLTAVVKCSMDPWLMLQVYQGLCF
jgi:hypothetical protein